MAGRGLPPERRHLQAGELTDYTWTKGTLQLPVDEPMPESLLRQLVEVMLNQLGF
ncbi:MAG TPA: hypothetical protein VLA91_07595 [Acidimicrobiia bacterium]|nr:hypothetical protein [Acidimicrobiia bacterium]